LNKIELVTKDQLEARLQACLEQRQMPDCFLYLDDSGVRNWLALSNSEEFPVASRLTGLLKQDLPSIVEHLSGKFDLVSIGVGSGEKERILLEALVQQGTPTYYAVDISSEMVEQALNTVTDINVDRIGVVAFLEDLEVLRQFWNPPVLLCLLGNNFCNYDPDSLLETIHAQLQSEDLFLFDCHLFPTQQQGEDWGREEVERMYRSQLNVRFNIDPLVRRGMNPDDCVFHLELLPVETSLGSVYRTTKWLDMLKDTTITCGPNKVLLMAGDTISLGFTYKYTPPQVQGYLRRYGFQEVELFLSPDEDGLLVLARKQLASRRM
jgi:uncharacterized SAM-dependent methyltransferase